MENLSHLHDTTGRFNTESQWVYIHKNDLRGTLSSGENTALNCCAESYSFIRVYAFAERLSEEFLQHSLDPFRCVSIFF